jgi:hypothetical protein
MNMRKLTLYQKQLVVKSVEQEIITWNKAFQCDSLSKQCLMWAYFTVKELHKWNIKEAQLQAGTAYWPIIPAELDDGVSANQYGYKFEWNHKSFGDVSTGQLPEMHCWVAIPEPITFIDLTSRFFKQRCLEHGFKWLMPDPPEFLWCEELPDCVTYQADMQAIEIAYSLLKTLMKKEPLSFRMWKPLEV